MECGGLLILLGLFESQNIRSPSSMAPLIRVGENWGLQKGPVEIG
jgi:hypothetical protein